MHANNAIEAERRVIRKGIYWAWKKGFMRVMIKCDFQRSYLLLNDNSYRVVSYEIKLRSARKHYIEIRKLNLVLSIKYKVEVC